MAEALARCLAHLRRAADHEAQGDLTAANAEYNAALRLEPRLAYAAQASQLPAPLPEFAWRRHRTMREWYRRSFAEALERTRREFPDDPLDRLTQSAEMFCGQRPLPARPELQRPHDLWLADLPPKPWLERADLPWAPALEAQTDAIRAEYLAVKDQAGFRPYIVKAQDASWRPLEGSTTWNSFFLYEGARRNAANCARCPITLQAVEALPLAQAGGVPTEVFFSVLAPGGHIPPHFGLSNAKVVVHLPLIVPSDCSLRVGTETRGWTEGQVLAFDDSFRHEARNQSALARVVLIFEVWNPELRPAEVVGVARMLEAVQRFKALTPSAS